MNTSSNNASQLGVPQGPKVFQEFGPDETECTFKPKINPISRSMATYLKPLHTEEGINFYIERKNRKLQELKEKIDREQEVKLEEYLEVLHKSSQKPGKRVDSEQVSLRLYQGGLLMLDRKKEFVDEYTKETCPFVPNRDKVRKEPLKGIDSFLKRNQVDCRQRDLKNQKVMLCDKNDMELKNHGRSRGKSRPQTRDASFDPVSKGKELYEKGMQRHKEQAELRKRPATPPPANSKTKAANEKYLKKMMSRRFEDIFFLLDSQNSGQINSRNVNLEAINPALLRVMSDMLFEIEDYNLSLSRPQFVRACSNLYAVGSPQQSLGFYDRTILLNHPLKSQPVMLRQPADPDEDGFQNDISLFSKHELST